MDEQEIHWLFGWHRGRFWLRSWLQVDPIFLHTSATNPTQHMTSMGQVTSKQPLIIIIRVKQEMMAWVSRKSIGFLDGIVEDFGSEVGHQVDPIFLIHVSATNSTQHDLHGPGDIQTTIDHHHHLDASRDDGMDEQEIHWLFG
jgi:hypothetical protein